MLSGPMQGAIQSTSVLINALPERQLRPMGEVRSRQVSGTADPAATVRELYRNAPGRQKSVCQLPFSALIADRRHALRRPERWLLLLHVRCHPHKRYRTHQRPDSATFRDRRYVFEPRAPGRFDGRQHHNT